MADNAPDRHLPASERKIDKAREEGQVARSRDLDHLAVLGVGMLMLAAGAPLLGGWLQRLLASGLSFDAKALAHPTLMTERLATQALDCLAVVLPVGGALALAALLASMLAGGWNFTWSPLAPRLDKLDPLSGLARMVSMQHLGTLLKACLLALVLGTVGTLYLQGRMSDFSALGAMPLPAALAGAGEILVGGVTWLMLPLVAFALIDVPFQRAMLLRRLRMSFEEVKKENKDVEGNTSVKAKIRMRMREMSNRRMLAAVPSADLVVMNPTHYAVALKYDEAGAAAPRVVAKGADLVALRIRDVARESGVPVLQSPPLARALYAHTELDHEIPAALFNAVAQVLAWVFQLRHAGSARSLLLATPPQPAVPHELDPANDVMNKAAKTAAEDAQ